MVAIAKLLMLNPNEFELWKMRIEQYFLMTHYALWEVILNGDSPPLIRSVKGVETPYPPTTVEEKLARRNELTARGTLLMALSNEHQLMCNSYKNANSLMEGIEKRFGEEVILPGNAGLLSIKTTGIGNYDWSDQAKDGPTNFALMDYTSLSSSSSDTEGTSCLLSLNSETTLKIVSAPIIEDWISDSEDEDEIETKSNQIKPSFAKNRVLVTKPHNKTPYELLLGRSPNIDFMKPIGYPVTILNTLDHLGRGPKWVFDINSLTISMNYEPVTAGNQTNHDAGKEIHDNTGQARQEKASDHEYILHPFMPSSTQSSDDKDADEVPGRREEGSRIND
nr:ribonuclease H-like domain-containing protein [Tanacetum cinerariifolium]